MAYQGGPITEGEHPRKLVILGLPWDTSEETLRNYFSQFGTLEEANVIRNKFTDKSRGFGFVSFVEPDAAIQVLSMNHTIDGRRCEAKIALPKAEGSGSHVTRVFVARIPSSVTEQQFRQYFESFGKIQDAYMPKDHAKQAYRGIGFVTYVSPDSVEKLVAHKHYLNGCEIAIDSATPKDEPFSARSLLFRQLGPTQRRSFDNGSRIIGPSMTSLMAYSASASLDRFAQLRAMGNLAGSDRELLGRIMSYHPEILDPSQMQASAAPTVVNSLTGPGVSAANSAAATAAASSLFAPSALHLGSPAPAAYPAGALWPGIAGSNFYGAGMENMLAGVADCHAGLTGFPCAAAVAASQRRSLDSQARRVLDSQAIFSKRAGPRIFIGKLPKDCTEAQVREHFSRFGFVIDVYLPKSRENRIEHRGFGFVTFETDAAIQRVVAFRNHRINNTPICIDLAMPSTQVGPADAAAAGAILPVVNVSNVAAAAAAVKELEGLTCPLP